MTLFLLFMNIIAIKKTQSTESVIPTVFIITLIVMILKKELSPKLFLARKTLLEVKEISS